jgi:hypothetical protein
LIRIFFVKGFSCKKLCDLIGEHVAVMVDEIVFLRGVFMVDVF